MTIQVPTLAQSFLDGSARLDKSDVGGPKDKDGLQNRLDTSLDSTKPSSTAGENVRPSDSASSAAPPERQNNTAASVESIPGTASMTTTAAEAAIRPADLSESGNVQGLAAESFGSGDAAKNRKANGEQKENAAGKRKTEEPELGPVPNKDWPEVNAQRDAVKPQLAGGDQLKSPSSRQEEC